jgi:hypothetical protein
VVYDLVTESGASSSTVKGIFEATAFFAKTSYVPTGLFTHWYMVQRPHFNSKGSKLATVISTDDVVTTYSDHAPTTGWGAVGAVFNPETWAILQRVNVPSRYYEGSTTTYGYEYVEDAYTKYTQSLGFRYETTESAILAFDFCGDNVAYVTYAYSNMRDRTIVGDKVHSWVAYSVTENSTESQTSEIGYVVSHSVIGELLTASRTVNFDATWYYYETAAGITRTWSSTKTPTYHTRVQVLGDLSKNIFAIGHGDTIDTATITTSDSANTTKVNYSQQLLYDVWVKGKKAANQVSGSFINPAVSSNTTVTAPVEYRAGGGGSFGTPGTYTSETTTEAASSASSMTNTYAVEADGQCAVNPRRTVAYISARNNAPFTVGATITVPVNGFEAAIFKSRLGTVPHYAGGSNPTISAPVFLGLKRTAK